MLRHKQNGPHSADIIFKLILLSKYCCYIKYGGITANLNQWNPWGYIADMWKCHVCVEHGLEYITFYVKKYIAHLVACFGPLLVRDWPLGAPARAGVKYVLSNTNTNTNTFFSGVSNTNTNTNTPAKIWSNTNTNTNTAHQIQIQIHNEAETKLPPFYRWHVEFYCIVRRLFINSNFTENCF